ncbi:MAG: acyltransferase [Candidatus Magasanikbacteria bacterium]|nr:acyltransferase [Candidatus Magasanikbacteria bacterium]
MAKLGFPPSPQFDVALLKSVGEDVFISSKVEIRRPQMVTIGNHVAIDTGFYLTTQADIGDYIHIGPYVSVIGGAHGLLKMGNFTNLAVGAKIVCVSDEFLGESLITAPGIPAEYTKLIAKPVILEDFANVGANAVIMPGVTLGEGSVVGACSLVTKDTKPWTIYYGTPAKPVKVRPRDVMRAYAKKLGY